MCSIALRQVRNHSDLPIVGGNRVAGDKISRVAGIIGYVLSLLLLSSLSLIAQPSGKGSTPPVVVPKAEQNTEKKGEETTPASSSLENVRPDEPVDLAIEFLVRDEDTGTSVFAKRALAPARPLAVTELEAINPQNKDAEISIPLRGYPPPDQAPAPNRPIYAEARLGLHLTTGLRAGLSGNSWPFDYHVAAGFESSQGFVENGQHSKFSAGIGGGYVIGLGYGIFSGGYMGANASYTTENYRLYAVPDAPERSLQDWGLSANGTAAWAGIDFEGTGRVRHAGVDEVVTGGTNSTLAETSVEGAIKLKTKAIGLGWQGGLDLRLTNATPGSINYGAFNLAALLETSVFSLSTGGRITSGGGTVGTAVTRIAPEVELRLFPVNGWTLSGKLSGGVRQTTVQNLVKINSWLALDGPILPEDERLGYEVSLHLEPGQVWGVRVGASRREFDSYLYFDLPANGRFAPRYGAASVNLINGDFYLKLDSRNDLLGVVRYTQGSIGNSLNVLPYMPRWDAELDYTRRLLGSPISLTGTARYIGKREGGTVPLDPAFLLGFEGSWTVVRHLDLILEGRNLLGQTYQLWEGYQEQGLYVGIGARARF